MNYSQAEYKWHNTTGNFEIYDADLTKLNTYVGGQHFGNLFWCQPNTSTGVYQQTTSALSDTNQQCYELTGGCFAIYAFEYKPG